MRKAIAAALALLVCGCAHVIPGSLTEDGKDFDFAQPRECRPATDPTKVEVRYLGSGGVYIRWRDDAILLGPSFSNPGVLRAGLWRAKFDEVRIERALRSIDRTKVRAILAGHRDYPRDLLLTLRPRHVVVSHFDNFFRKDEGSTRFVPTLTSSSASRFLRIVKDHVQGDAGPSNEVCGIETRAWTMPVVGATLLFEPRRAAVPSVTSSASPASSPLRRRGCREERWTAGGCRGAS